MAVLLNDRLLPIAVIRKFDRI